MARGLFDMPLSCFAACYVNSALLKSVWLAVHDVGVGDTLHGASLEGLEVG